jgi:hypothetical protein
MYVTLNGYSNHQFKNVDDVTFFTIRSAIVLYGSRCGIEIVCVMKYKLI